MRRVRSDRRRKRSRENPARVQDGGNDGDHRGFESRTVVREPTVTHYLTGHTPNTVTVGSNLPERHDTSMVGTFTDDTGGRKTGTLGGIRTPVLP